MTDTSEKKPWYAVLASQGAIWTYIAIVVALLAFVAVPHCSYERGAGSFAGAMVLGDILYVGESYEIPAGENDSETRGRMTALELSHGARLSRVAFYDTPRCAPATGDRIWCYARGKISLYDVTTKKVRASTETWFHSGGDLGDDYDGRLDPELTPSGELLTRALDGRYVAIDPSTEIPRVLTSPPGNIVRLRWPASDSLPTSPATSELIEAINIVTNTAARVVRHRTSMDVRAGVGTRIMAPDGTVTLDIDGGQFGGPRGVIAIGEDRVLFVDTKDGLVAVRFAGASGAVVWKVTL